MARSIATPDAPEDVTELADAFDVFVRAAKRHRARMDPDATLTTSQVDLMTPLLEGDPDGLGLRELARVVGVAAPTATRMVDGLEGRGLVSRARDPQDGRAVRITLTAEGRAALLARREQMLARREAMFDLLTPGDRRVAVGVLARLAEAFERS